MDRAALAIAATLLVIALVILWDAMALPRRCTASARAPCRSSSRFGLILLAIGNA